MLLGLGLLALAQAAAAPSLPPPSLPPPSPCVTADYRAFDFWVGSWDVYPNPTPGRAQPDRAAL
jgi:hypothetical protein